MPSSKILSTFLICLFPIFSNAQLTSIDHWETVVFETDTWDYFSGNSAPPANWNQPNFTPFNTTHWESGFYFYAVYEDNQLVSNGKLLKYNMGN